MQKTVQVDIPANWLKGVDWDQMLVQEILELGVHEYKVRQALKMLQSGNGSVGYVADQIGLLKRDVIVEARWRGIEPPFDEQALREELDG